MKILHVFSGPGNRVDGFAATISRIGGDCDEIDTLIDEELRDLTKDSVWTNLFESLPKYDGSMWGTPCTTFSSARPPVPEYRGFPRQLRGKTGRDRYGISSLTAREADEVKVGTLLAVRTATALKELIRLRRPWIYENPWPRGGTCSMVDLDEFLDIVSHPEVITRRLDQCRCGARSEKATLLMAFLTGMPSSDLRCNHPRIEWVVPKSGEVHRGAHPQLKGSQWAVPLSEFDPDITYLVEKEYLTKSASAYSTLTS